MYYSNMVFKGLDMSSIAITALIGLTDFCSTIVGFFLLMCFGRRTIMLVGNTGMVILLFTISYFSFDNHSIGIVVCTLIFIALFEFSSGLIIWLYLAEILHDKALGIAIALNWFFNLIISITTPFVLK